MWFRRGLRDEHHRAAVSIGLGAAVTGLYLLGAGRSYTYDESVSIARFISPGSPRVALTEQFIFNNHPVFSVGQALLWRLGGDTETWQRVPPVLYAAAAVALLAWMLIPRIGLVAALTAAVVVAANPLYVEQARLVRGYSVAALGVVVAAATIVEYLAGGRRWLLAVSGAATVVAVGTHLYAGVAIAAVAAAVVAWWWASGRRPDPWVLGTWVAAAVVAGGVYLPTFQYLRDVSAQRGFTYHPSFGADAAAAVLGDHVLAVILMAVLCAAAIAAVWSRGRASPAVAATLAGTAVAIGAITFVWLVLQPHDLYPRFLVVVVPAVGLAAGVAVQKWPRLVLVALLAVVAMTVTNMRSWSDEAPIPRRRRARYGGEGEWLGAVRHRLRWALGL